jgi:hypothetical protein
MSFASTLATPGAALTRAIPGVLRGSTLAVMSRTVGIVVGAGMLAAVYQVTQEETKVTLSSWRERRRYRVARHEALLIVLLGSPLSYAHQERLLASNDAFKTALEVLADPATEPRDRECIRAALRHVAGGANTDQATA